MKLGTCRRAAVHRSSRFLLAVGAAFLVTAGSAGWCATGQAEVIVNQIGNVPLVGLKIEDFKFAIITADGAETATATAVIAGGKVTGFTVGNAGTGYLVPPAVVISGGGGVGAKATAQINAGAVVSLKLTATGNGYLSAPTVTIAPSLAKPAITTLWSNDGSSVKGSEPTAAVTLQVVDRGFSALLGYTGLPNMAALPRAILANLDARVRIWYKTGAAFKVLVPDAPLSYVPYAEEATFAETAGTVSDGAITSSKLVAGAVTSDKIGAGAITADKLAPGAVAAAGPPALLTSLSPNDSALSGLGYSRLQTIPGHDWVPSADQNGPSARVRNSAIWTGTNFIVWGGSVSGQLSSQGGEYSATTKSWTLLSTFNPPAARADHTAVWTGGSMVVWGGVTDAEPGGTASGGIFSEAKQSWRGLSGTLAPSFRTQHTAVWCGDRMVVWGGNSAEGIRDDGGICVPPLDTAPSSDTGTWTPLPPSFVAGVRRGHTAVWTGSRMIVWGGLDGGGDPLGSGAALDPSGGNWTSLPTLNAPSPRFAHTATWTGSLMIVFGGADSEVDQSNGHVFNDGAAYDPAKNTWTRLTSTGAPESRSRHGAVWSGAEMLVFSGQGVGASAVFSGGAFNPVTNAWRPLPSLPSAPSAPSGPTQNAGAWSGQALLSFGLSGLEVLDPSPTVYLYGRF